MNGLEVQAWKVDTYESVGQPAAREHPGAGVEEESPSRKAEFVQQHVHGRDRRVAAQVDFDRRGKPSQRPVIANLTYERRLRDPELERDQLHLVVGQGVLEQHDHRRVAPLAIPDETVDPPETVPEGDVYGIHH